jgi:hypothetical protein
MAAEDRRPLTHARIGVLRALNCKLERTFTDRKEMHWGKAEAQEGPMNRTGRRARRPAISCLRRGTSSRGRCHA